MKARIGFITRWAAAAVLAAVMVSGPRVAGAQTDQERAGARAAATEGLAAMQAQRWSDAVDLFTRAESLVHAPPHLLYLARAYEKLGKLVKARETYEKLVRESLASNAPAAFTSAQQNGRDELAALQPRVPTLKVTLKGPSEGVVVTVDNVALAPALVGVACPVDPGEHNVQASGQGLAGGPAKIALREGANEAIEIELHPSNAATAPPPGQPTGPAASPPVQAATATSVGGSTAPDKPSSLRTISYVTMGGGVAALVVGGVFALKSHDKRAKGDELCPNGVCQSSDKDQIDALDRDATSAGRIATTGFIVGGAAVATGVTLFILSGKKQSDAPRAAAASVTPWIGLGSAGLSGRF